MNRSQIQFLKVCSQVEDFFIKNEQKRTVQHSGVSSVQQELRFHFLCYFLPSDGLLTFFLSYIVL